MRLMRFPCVIAPFMRFDCDLFALCFFFGFGFGFGFWIVIRLLLAFGCRDPSPIFEQSADAIVSSSVRFPRCAAHQVATNSSQPPLASGSWQLVSGSW